MASTTLLYSVLEYLNGLKSTSERPEAIDSISTQIQEIFGLQISPENFKELSYSPVGLNEIFSAGVNALDLQHYEESLSNAQLNPKFDAFVSTVQKKGFFDGAEEGSVEYLQRYSKLINKFKDKTVAKASTAPSTAASVVEAAPVENNAEIEKQAEELKSQGNTAISAKNYLEAAVLYSKALKLSSEGPNSHIYYSNRAAAYCHLGKYQEAVNDCKASLALSADYVKAFSRLGLSYFFLEQYEDAVEAYKRAVDLEPDNKASIDSLRQAQNKLAKVDAGKVLNSPYSITLLTYVITFACK